MLSAFKIVPFSKEFERNKFESESELLNHYLQKQVSQDIKRRVTSCFLAIDSEQKVMGYYTLASMSIALRDLPDTLQKKLPRYPTVPAVLLGRLAVDKQATGQGLGHALLGNALKRVINSDIAAYALIVDAKDERAVNFYLKFGFIPFQNESNRLFFPLEKVGDLL
ncbi:GNAT family N-acetyltransferase [Rodentibacter ratti]|uniref:GNAT family N-acetyltransferase n=2 Tax=Rodentibacter TaxID=1960084 RepID=A0A1V3L4M3_9PAST|nr:MULTISPECIES: GNAT family N-acetyltransferase [Rodentibacter]OOF79677.1 GNAT family N-acetyltransferase [Rodentibacter heylii]OOF84795.1 GNAT family N-acetyltransferase [Rodentibacter ratti]QIA76779.1 GNAT family N-acetyltransferase [Rodentibacter heylii]